MPPKAPPQIPDANLKEVLTDERQLNKPDSSSRVDPPADPPKEKRLSGGKLYTRRARIAAIVEAEAQRARILEAKNDVRILVAEVHRGRCLSSMHRCVSQEATEGWRTGLTFNYVLGRWVQEMCWVGVGPQPATPTLTESAMSSSSEAWAEDWTSSSELEEPIAKIETASIKGMRGANSASSATVSQPLLEVNEEQPNDKKRYRASSSRIIADGQLDESVLGCAKLVVES